MMYNDSSIDAKISKLLTLQEIDARERDTFRGEIKSELGQIKTHCEYTNGKIAQCVQEIESLKSLEEARKRDLAQIITLKKILSNKYTWVGVGFVLAILLKYPMLLKLVSSL